MWNLMVNSQKKVIERIETGIVLGDGTQCKPANIDVLSEQSLHITIEEGKYHQVKRMIGAAGGEVTYLKEIVHRSYYIRWD